jgi:hypothetical protein
MKMTIAAALAATFASISCSIFIGGPSYEIPTAVVSPEPANSVPTELQGAQTVAADTGTLTLQVSEAQLTSYVAARLGELTDPIITDPQVLLRDGQLTMYGTARSGLLIANIRLSMRVSADENGQPRIQITQTDFGPLPLPTGLNDAVSAMVQEALTGTLGPAAIGFRLETITVGDGVMTLTGRVK